MASDDSVKNPEVNETQEPEQVKEPEKLTPETVDNTSSSEKEPEDSAEKTSLFKQPGFWKNFSIILCAVILVGAIAGVAGYYAGKKGNSEKSSRSNDSEGSSSEVSVNYLTKSADKMANTLKKRKHKDIVFTADDIKKFCTDNGLQIQSGDTDTGFLAINDTMGVIITVEEHQGKTFDDLVAQLVTSSAPLNSRAFDVSDNFLIYEGYLDKDQPEYGYCYLELLYGEKYYIFLQGLGDTPSAADIAQMRILAFRLEKLLKLK
ncbi:MAG: hypothetical protein J6Y58_01695 [Clostridiales bacterium]|nr:hypothetical protein [Clostridiales bacterium]